MGQVLDSVDNMIRSASDNGMLSRMLIDTIAATTAANTTSGYVSAGMFPFAIFTVPRMGSGVSVAYLTAFGANQSASAGSMVLAVAIFSMGSINMNTGTFTPGVSMPIRPIGKQAQVQTATERVFLYVSSAVTATTPLVTITYTNQDGTANQSAALTLPTGVTANSVYFVDPHLASGDTGMRSVSNITKSAGTAGTIVCYGAWVLGYSMAQANFVAQSPGPLALPRVPWPLVKGDQIAFVRHGLATACDLFAYIGLLGDN